MFPFFPFTSPSSLLSSPLPFLRLINAVKHFGSSQFIFDGVSLVLTLLFEKVFSPSLFALRFLVSLMKRPVAEDDYSLLVEEEDY